MKKLVLILFVIAFAFPAISQEPTKQKEVGLVFSNLSNFGFTYKIGTEKAMWRFGSMYTSGDFLIYENDANSNNTFSLGFSLGKEYRKKVAEKLEFRYGADISMTSRFNKYKTTSNSTLRLTPGINAVVGLNYLINDHLVFGAELLPGIYYNYLKQKTDNNVILTTTTVKEFWYDFSTNSAQLSLVYRIK